MNARIATDDCTPEALAARSLKSHWKPVIHGPNGTTCPYEPGTRSAHRFDAARDEWIGKRREKWRDNAGEFDETVNRLAKRPICDTDTRE